MPNPYRYDRFACCIALATLALACDTKAKTDSDDSYTPEEIAQRRAQLGLDRSARSVSADELPDEPPPEPEPPRPALTVEPVLTALNPSLEQVASRLPGAPIGSVGGSVLGSPQEKRDLLGLVVTHCGDGLVFQAIYSPPEGSKDAFHTSSPFQLMARDLVSGNARTYTDRGFDVALEVTHAELPKRLAGSLRITNRSTKVPFVEATFDGPTLDSLLPVEGLEALEQLPVMAKCFATARYTLVTDDGATFTGLAHMSDYGNRGVPRAIIPITPRDTLELLVVPPAPYTAIEGPTSARLAETWQPNSRPFVALAKLFHIPIGVDPASASTKNLMPTRTTSIKQGNISVALSGTKPKLKDPSQPPAPRTKAKDLWRATITLEDLVVPKSAKGPLRDRTIRSLTIDGLLMDDRAPLSALPEGVEVP